MLDIQGSLPAENSPLIFITPLNHSCENSLTFRSSHKKISKWTKLRHEKPNTQHVYIARGGTHPTVSGITPKSSSLKLIQKKNCLNQFEMKFDKRSTFKKIRTGKGFWRLDETRSQFTKFLINNLNEIDEEIILLNHDVRKPFFPKSLPKIEYSSMILQQADKTINDLQPFIAIYWRLENSFIIIVIYHTLMLKSILIILFRNQNKIIFKFLKSKKKRVYI